MHQKLLIPADGSAARVLDHPKFSPGQIVATPGALAAMEDHRCEPLSLLTRHLSGDWGSLPVEDGQMNDQALQFEGRLLSSYPIGPDTKIWLITEADRSATTFLLPSEY
jgi:hypothetical protein